MFGGDEESPKDQMIAELQDRLESEKDARNEERFIWILVLVLFVDIVAFTQMDNFGGPTAILVIELFLLTVLGKRLGVDDVTVLTNKLLDKLPIKTNGD